MSNDWVNRVNKIKEKYFSASSLDLVNCFYRLHGAIQGRKLLLDASSQLTSERKMIQKEIEEEEKSLTRLSKLSELTRMAINGVIEGKKKHCKDLMNFLDNSSPIIPVKKTLYSVTIMYIQTLAAIFHSVTGDRPICLRREYYDDEDYYYGDFYNFLIDSKELVKELGVLLPNNASIGRRAFELAKWDKKDGMQYHVYGDAFHYLEIYNPIY